MPNQTHVAYSVGNAKTKTGASDEEAQPSDKVYDLENARPAVGKSINYGSTEEARNGGLSAANKVIDHIDATFKLNKDPNLQSNV